MFQKMLKQAKQACTHVSLNLLKLAVWIIIGPIIYLEIRYRTITELVYGYPIVENVMRARRQCVYQRCMVPAAITGF